MQRRPPGDLEVLGDATSRLQRDVAALTDAQVEEPSLLPGWNRAEVITHLARNADGTRRMVEAATRGEVAEQYPGGAETRRAEIAAGRAARADDLRRDLDEACVRMMSAWRALPPDTWDRGVGRAISGTRTMREAMWSRVREVEIHHLDLAVGYEPSDWPVAFVRGALDELFSTFDRRAAPGRPAMDAAYRVVSTDHDAGWRVVLRGRHVAVDPTAFDTEGDGEPVDGEARGWGCDVVAWLYGRDPRGGSITATGDLAVLQLPQWFPFA